MKTSKAAAIIACIWIYNVAFNIPIFLKTSVYISSWSGKPACYSKNDPNYVLAARIINFYAPLAITWTSNIGIIYRLRTTMNKVIA